MPKYPVTKARDEDGEIIESTYEYRGFRFERDDKVAPGYWNRYKILRAKTLGCMNAQPTQAAVKTIIDNYLAKQEAAK